MPHEHLTEAEAAQRFADQIDEINRRTRLYGPADPERLRRILERHEAACAALEKAEREAELSEPIDRT